MKSGVQLIAIRAPSPHSKREKQEELAKRK
jgi:hypothetical protein